MSLIASVSDSLKIWQFVGDNFNLQASLEYPRERLLTVAWNHTNQVVAVGGSTRKVDLVQVSSCQLLSTLPFSENDSFTSEIKSLCFSSNSRYLATGSGRIIKIWDLKKREINSVVQGHRGAITCVKFFIDGQMVSGDDLGALKIWNVKDNLSTVDLIPPTSKCELSCLELSNNNPNRIACGYTNGNLCIWDPVSQSLLRQQNLHSSTMTSMAFSPKNARLVATGGHDGRITLVDIGSKNTSDPSASIDIGERISALCFHSDAIHSVVGTTSGNILLYDWRNVRKPLSTTAAHRPYPVHSLAFQVPEAKVASIVSTPSLTTQQPKQLESTSSTTASTVRPSQSTIAIPTTTTTTTAEEVVTSNTRSSYDGIPSSNNNNNSNNNSTTQNPPLNTHVRSTTTTTVDPHSQSIISLSKIDSPPVNPIRSGLAYRNEQRSDNNNSNNNNSNNNNNATTTATSYRTPNIKSTHVHDLEYEHRRRVPEELSHHDSTTSTSGGGAAAAVGGGLHYAPSLGSGIDEGKSSESHHLPHSHNYHRPLSTSSLYNTNTNTTAMSMNINGGDSKHSLEFEDLKQAMRPVNSLEMQEALQLLKYDIHREIQGVIREQVRQFSIAKDDTAKLIAEMSSQLSALLKANEELRAENERLRHIY